MIPDKIYIREYPDGINQFWDREKRDDVVGIIYHGYIRKDALLEWAKAVKADPMIPMNIDKVIEKIKSL